MAKKYRMMALLLLDFLLFVPQSQSLALRSEQVTPKVPPPVITAANAAQLKPAALIARDEVDGLTWSPDGKLLAVWGAIKATGGTWLYDTDNLNAPPSLLEDVGYPLAFNTRGTTIVAPDADNSGVHLWDLRTGAVVNDLPGQSELYGLSELSFSTDGQKVIEVSRNGVQQLAAATGALLSTALPDSVDPIRLELTALSHDGRLLATEDWNSDVQVWDLKSGTVIATIPNDVPMDQLLFSADGTYLLASGLDHTKLLNLKTNQVVTDQQDYAELAQQTGLAFSPDGQILALLQKVEGLVKVEFGRPIQAVK